VCEDIESEHADPASALGGFYQKESKEVDSVDTIKC